MTAYKDIPDIEAALQERSLLAKKYEIMKKRAAVMAAARSFFDCEGFLEVNTPSRIPTPALEDYIEAVPSENSWLRTSPEFHMKRLLAAGYEKIWQIGPCFRKDEDGSRHRLEFTMLEWYRSGADWIKVMDDTAELIKNAAIRANRTTLCRFRNTDIDVSLPWEKISVEKAFMDFAGMNLDKCIADGMFEEVLVTKVEPNLGINGKLTALTEYPLACSGLSRRIPGSENRVERWEVYAAGLELGNACSELAEPVEQALRFKQCADLREREQRIVYQLDQPFLDAMRAGMPDAAGVAIGMDRLVMLITGRDDIAEVNAF